MAPSVLSSRTLEDILIAANKRPQTNVAKLIYTVRDEPSQRNICLLLSELAKNKEFYTDFSIPLGYYLELFQQQDSGHELLNQAGVLLSASGEIYARRVDYVQELVEHLIGSLSQADKEIEEAKQNGASETQTQNSKEPAKRPNRKRLVQAQSDPFEIEMQPKKTKLLSKERRNTPNKIETKAIKTFSRSNYNEDQIHPALYLLSSIVDFENDEDVESKKNFQVFTYRLEHRYSTVVPDVNFRLHFVVKDYLDEEGERMQEQELETQREWPPLSEEYLQNLIMLENKILRERDMEQDYDESNAIDACNGNVDADFNMKDLLPSNKDDAPRPSLTMEHMFNDLKQNNELNSSMLNGSREQEKANDSLDQSSSLSESLCNQNSQESSGIGESLASSNMTNQSSQLSMEVEDSQANNSMLNQSTETSLFNNSDANDSTNLEAKEVSGITTLTDSGVGDSLQSTPNTTVLNETDANKTTTAPDDSSNPLEGPLAIDTALNDSDAENNDPNRAVKQRSPKKPCSNLSNIDPELAAVTINGVPFHELPEMQRRQLMSPSIVAIDLLPDVTNKEHLCIELDDELKYLFNAFDDDDVATTHPEPQEVYDTPPELIPSTRTLELNILQINVKHFKRRCLFKLTDEFDNFIKMRTSKRKRLDEPPACIMTGDTRELQMFREFQQREAMCLSPTNSEADFLGFESPTTDGEETMSLLGDEEFAGFQSVERDLQVTSRHLIKNNKPSKVLEEPTLQADTATCNSPNAIEGMEKPNSTPTERVEETTSIEELPASAEEALTTPANTEENVDPPASKEEDIIIPTAKDKELVALAITDEEPKEVADSSEAVIQSATMTDESRTFDDANDSDDEIDDDLEMSTKRKIQNWHESLRPILAKSRERHHFNVFDLGTEIIDTVKVNKEATFSDAMANKDPSFCSRYFLSLLLLINQNNIEVKVSNKNSEEPTEWSDIQLGLLSTKRHTVMAEDDIGCITKPTMASNEPNNSNKCKNSGSIMKTMAVNIAEETPPRLATTNKFNLNKLKPSINYLMTPNVLTPPDTPLMPPFAASTPMLGVLQQTQLPHSSHQQQQIMPLSCHLASRQTRKRLSSSDEFNVNLNTFRIVQSIEQKPIQNDEQDSGFSSNDARSFL